MFIASPAFMKLAVDEAVKFLASKANSATSDDIRDAYKAGVENIVNRVNELVMEAAEVSAARANKENW